MPAPNLPFFAPTERLRAEGPFLTDEAGRSCLVRGLNVGGNSKFPRVPDQPSHVRGGFVSQHRTVSFVGRPFPIEQADAHFRRLRAWGCNLLRWVVTWEAIEHAGPGIYDLDYLEYLVHVLEHARDHGMKVFIDPHQDTWSRFTGGSGAPGWTLELAGMNIAAIHDSHAGLVMSMLDDPKDMPPMIWPTNYYKLACATMFTLFFAGDLFARGAKTNPALADQLAMAGYEETASLQHILQSCYIGSMVRLARMLKDHRLLGTVVVGFDTMNEPSCGWIGIRDLGKMPPQFELHYGNMPTPLQSLMLAQGDGKPCRVQYYTFGGCGPKYRGKRELVSQVRLWADGCTCIWAQAGVWDPSMGKLLRPDHFSRHPDTDRKLDFVQDCWLSFVARFGAALRQVDPTTLIFLEPPVMALPPRLSKVGASVPDPDPVLSRSLVYAPHWYDGFSNVTGRMGSFNVDIYGWVRGKYDRWWNKFGALHFGEASVRRMFESQHALIRKEGLDRLGPFPCLLGEMGMPARIRTKWRKGKGQTDLDVALDAGLSAADASLLSATVWNYCTGNSQEWGDGFNLEDFSLLGPGDDRAEKSDLQMQNVKSLVAGEGQQRPGHGDHNDAGLDKETQITGAQAKDLAQADNLPNGHLSGGKEAEAAHLPAKKPSADGPAANGPLPHDHAHAAPAPAEGARSPSEAISPSTAPFPLSGRGLAAFCRPTWRRCLGRPLHMRFNMRSMARTFEFAFLDYLPGERPAGPDIEPDPMAPTVFYLPRLHYADPVTGQYDVAIKVSDGTVELDPEHEALIWTPGETKDHRHKIRVRRKQKKRWLAV